MSGAQQTSSNGNSTLGRIIQSEIVEWTILVLAMAAFFL